MTREHRRSTSAADRPRLQTLFTLSPETEIELYSVRNTHVYLAKLCEEAGDQAGAGMFRLLADATTRVIDGLSEEVREVT
ncbi:MAG: hypothetical protein AAFY42_02865 [Pseudomonadota bacterium]